MENIDNMCTEIPEGFSMTEVYDDNLFSDDISDKRTIDT